MKILAIIFAVLALIVAFLGGHKLDQISRIIFFTVFSLWSMAAYIYSAKDYRGGVVSIVGAILLGIGLYSTMFSIFLMDYSVETEIFIVEIIANAIVAIIFLFPGLVFVEIGHKRHMSLLDSDSVDTEKNVEKVLKQETGNRNIILGIIGLVAGLFLGALISELTSYGINKLILFLAYSAISILGIIKVMPLEYRFLEKLYSNTEQDQSELPVYQRYEEKNEFGPLTFFFIVGVGSGILLG